MKNITRIGPQVHVCSFVDATGSGTWNGKTYYWDFSERFGPLFTTSKGDPCRTQPTKGPAWKAFAIWLQEYQAARSEDAAAIHAAGKLPTP